MVASTAQASPPGGQAATRSARSSLDYSALTLESNQVRLGPADVDIGVLRGLQVGTDPMMDAIGVYNLRSRVGGHVGRHAALAAEAAAHTLQLGDMQAHHVRLGLRGSTWLGPVGLHVGARGGRLSVSGHPDLSAAAPLLHALMGEERMVVAQRDLDSAGQELRVHTTTLSIHAAAELRVAPAHAIVLQGGDAIARRAAIDPTSRAAVDTLSSKDQVGQLLESDGGRAAWGSIGWQVSGRHLRLRAGVGLSDIPLAWLTPAMELSWVLGGKQSPVIAEPALADQG